MSINVRELAEYLGERIVRTGKRHGLLYIETTRRKYLLKPIADRHHVLWWQRVDRAIRERGFTSMPDFFVWKNEWLVMRFISGRQARYSRYRDVMVGAQLLARFHVAARGIESGATRGREAATLAQRVQKRFEQYEQSCREPVSFLPAAVRDDYRRWGEWALRKIEASPIHAVTRFEKAKRAVAHRDLASHNIVIGKGGKPWLIDFETAAFDAQIGDVWQMTSRTLVEWHWDPRVYEAILANYQLVRPLRPEEQVVLDRLLMFPNDFFREQTGLLKGRRGYSLQKVAPYLLMMVQDRPRWLQFLRWLGVAW
ncbi:protein kinase family protein [Numidum massiliense]|uniref:hypothetical protein n=1 Tax=Numidum massiliense TaxID=1522315 RepID=UPI0006D57CA6|nr:hypothetical protein [Numidum massiliense]